MRIDDNNPALVNASTASASPKLRAASEPSSAPAKSANAAKSGDKVQFSSVASQVSAESLSIQQSVSAERASRIEHLTKLVQSGQYNPDPKKIADSMIREALSGSSPS